MEVGIIIAGFIIGILVVLFLVLVHEFGHFLLAKLAKAYVYEFAVGFGPRLFTFKGKETWYSIRLIPLGGYVWIASDKSEPPKGREDLADTIPDERKMDYAKRWKKAFFIISGPVVNFLLAAFIITTTLMASMYKPDDMSFYGQRFSNDSVALKMIQTVDSEYKSEDQTYAITEWNYKLGIYEHSANTDLYDVNQAKAKDYETIVYNFKNEFDLVDWNTLTIEDINEIELSISFKPIDKVSGAFIGTTNEEITVSLKDNPILKEEFIKKITNDKKVSIGITAPYRYFKNTTEAYGYGWKETANQSISLIKGIGQLFTGNFDALSGPVGMANQTANVLDSPTEFFLYFGGISANLFMLNMLPIPPLDGYKFLENAVEAAIRRDLNKKYKYIAYSIGAILFIGIFVLITIKDLIM
ncbi:RIP metalloprotease RseP [Mesoplasma photuris]|uniref:RIP metalloprotease RseP n=1 Tax=Mesoplasma photuris TaxID=217731 RepID=UPI000690AF37|nr:RIP metalloprotease RseP [Mesoplasma photuris]